MGLVQYLVIVLMLYAQVVLTSPLAERSTLVTDKKCKMCSAGEFQKSCTECEPCPAGSFTNDRNSEDSCHRCFGDCRSDYHLKVVENCTSTSDLKCVCEAGFKCNDKVRYSTVGNCRSCVKIPETPRNVATAPTPGNDKQTPSSVSSGHTITSAKPCQFSECQQSVPPTPSADAMSSQLAAILGPLAIMGCLALVILFCVCHQGDETCFKQAIAKICNEGKQDASHKSKESSHQFPRDSFCAKQQPPSLSAANLGSVHVHNPGTVIFSLLSQFTGQVGATIEGGKAAETVGSEEEDERDCPVCHPTSSPSIHLSEEERSGEIDSIFFPSQEQGKDCHMSKEEEL
ncbi:tumor necrosis factor receptor superfamily member 5-like isoform X1 [Seriola dumerili]|uniref:tumor necrosis factor receptor superfamily member 5-like isoform X1 n=1 Tax=Seriola dumerili TaxID=41447 RepID=UPI000BBF364E|nr:tumor necrosis factor receptor superfamily member 5-like isoform X1 [Seriola dumerili]